MNAFAILATTFLLASSGNASEVVSISLFSLFKPEAAQVRIASGNGAVLDATGLTSLRAIGREAIVKIRLSSGRLILDLADSEGVVERSVMTDTVRIVPDGPAKLEIVLPGRIKRAVRGTLIFDAGKDGRGPLRILLSTGREAAVAAVVAAEMTSRHPAALMTLAVVVRTFMHSQARRHLNEGFDFCDTTHCQLYRGEQDLTNRVTSSSISRAMAATAGQILTYKSRAVEGYYTAACGGLSATPQMIWGGATNYPYQRIACRWCRQSRFGRWERAANVDAVIKAISAFIVVKLSAATELIIDADRDTGLVQSVTVRDQNRSVVLNTDSFRRAVGLRLGWSTVLSPTFRIERRGARFIFKGVGFGSQVGLCEEGAVAQAATGRTYREILNFYYPGADIVALTPND